MKDNFYSDNMLDSFETEKEAIEFTEAVTKSLETGGFSLTTFASSSTKVLKTIRQHSVTSAPLQQHETTYIREQKKEEILRHSTVSSWHFISSADNPADDSTQGTTL